MSHIALDDKNKIYEDDAFWPVKVSLVLSVTATIERIPMKFVGIIY